MRAPSFLPLRLRASLGDPRRLAAVLVEAVIWGWVVVVLEALGPRKLTEGADLVGFLFGGLLAMVLVAAARAGGLPFTVRAAGALKRGVLALGRRVAPPAGVAFRLPEEPPALPDHARRVPTGVLLLLALVALPSGDAVLRALSWVKAEASYTVYLVGLAVLWAVFGTVTVVALLTARAAALRRRAGWMRSLPLVVWVAAVLACAWLPGWVPLALLPLLVLGVLPFVLRRPPGRYHLYRREADGRFRAVTIDGYLRSAFFLAAAFLSLVAALAQAPRLGRAMVPSGAFALTLALGISATVGALYLVLRAGLHVRQIYGHPRRSPEIPLVPTLWWPGGDEDADWVVAARQRGWRIACDARPPAGGFDLVVGHDDDPRRFRPVEGLPVDDALFRLERRFHVVMRRAFHRRFHSLHKMITAPPRPAGCGYLFCPFAWPVRGVVRDTGGVDPDDPDGRPLGGALVGLPYEAVFAPRLRRYLGGVFRALDLDVLYWEDRVAWDDLRRVTGILFETYDQRRFPAEDRHFVGLARIRVVIQEPEDGDDTGPGEAPSEDVPPPLRARVLVVRRDDGGREVEAPDRAPSTRRPEPVLV